MLYLFPAANDVSSVMGRDRGIGRTRVQMEVQKTETATCRATRRPVLRVERSMMHGFSGILLKEKERAVFSV